MQGNRPISRLGVIIRLRVLHHKLGRVPQVSDITERSLLRGLYTHFNTLREALEAAACYTWRR